MTVDFADMYYVCVCCTELVLCVHLLYCQAAQSPDPFEEEERRAREKQQLKMDRREFRKHKEMVTRTKGTHI